MCLPPSCCSPFPPISRGSCMVWIPPGYARSSGRSHRSSTTASMCGSIPGRACVSSGCSPWSASFSSRLSRCPATGSAPGRSNERRTAHFLRWCLTRKVSLWYNTFDACAPVAQLDRASDSDSEGHRFDSCRAYAYPLARLRFAGGIALFRDGCRSADGRADTEMHERWRLFIRSSHEGGRLWISWRKTPGKEVCL